MKDGVQRLLNSNQEGATGAFNLTAFPRPEKKKSRLGAVSNTPGKTRLSCICYRLGVLTVKT